MKTDAQIQLDVIAELKYEPTIHQSNIGVSVKEGIVALRGEIEHYFEKYHLKLLLNGSLVFVEWPWNWR